MSEFVIVRNYAARYAEMVRCPRLGLTIDVINPEKDNRSYYRSKYTYQAHISAQPRAIVFVIEPDEQPPGSTLWNEETLINAVKFYLRERGYTGLNALTNTRTHDVIYCADNTAQNHHNAPHNCRMAHGMHRTRK